ncbi:hypothetical protein PHSC3_000819 [Chlamydiales bacterium STE3]|nr:hypothetical protein PHSC3_000819 [Chlamydiales bacterium STE3]
MVNFLSKGDGSPQIQLHYKKAKIDFMDIPPPQIKAAAVCKDAFAKLLHKADPDLPIEVLNKLPTEEIANWYLVVAPENSHRFFHDWLDNNISKSYADQSKLEQELEAIYTKFKAQDHAKIETHTEIDKLARDILKEYSKTIEEKATDDAFLTLYFAKTLKIPSESTLMQLTIRQAKKPIAEIVSQRLGYLYSDKPRKCLKKILANDYPTQIDQISYLTDTKGKAGRKIAPLWAQ